MYVAPFDSKLALSPLAKHYDISVLTEKSLEYIATNGHLFVLFAYGLTMGANSSTFAASAAVLLVVLLFGMAHGEQHYGITETGSSNDTEEGSSYFRYG